MRFLLDQNLSPLLVELLGGSGHDVVHVRDLGLHKADDSELVTHAVADERIIISADTDFGYLFGIKQRISAFCIATKKAGWTSSR